MTKTRVWIQFSLKEFRQPDVQAPCWWAQMATWEMLVDNHQTNALLTSETNAMGLTALSSSQVQRGVTTTPLHKLMLTICSDKKKRAKAVDGWFGDVAVSRHARKNRWRIATCSGRRSSKLKDWRGAAAAARWHLSCSLSSLRNSGIIAGKSWRISKEQRKIGFQRTLAMPLCCLTMLKSLKDSSSLVARFKCMKTIRSQFLRPNKPNCSSKTGSFRQLFIGMISTGMSWTQSHWIRAVKALCFAWSWRSCLCSLWHLWWYTSRL